MEFYSPWLRSSTLLKLTLTPATMKVTAFANCQAHRRERHRYARASTWQSSVLECWKVHPVSRSLLESLAAGHVHEQTAVKVPLNDGVKVEWLHGFLEHYKVSIIGERQNGQRYFIDVSALGPTSTVAPPVLPRVAPAMSVGGNSRCFHSECVKQERGWIELKSG